MNSIETLDNNARVLWLYASGIQMSHVLDYEEISPHSRQILFPFYIVCTRSYFQIVTHTLSCSGCVRMTAVHKTYFITSTSKSTHSTKAYHC